MNGVQARLRWRFRNATPTDGNPCGPGCLGHVARRPSPLPAAVAALVLFAGCHSETHEQKVTQAEQNWAHLRSNMKTRLAAQQLETGRVDQAVTSLRGAIQASPADPTLYRALARCHIEQGDLRAATDATDRAAALGDTSADLSYTRGLVAEQRQRYGDALAHHSQAAALDPQNVDYVVAVAECMMSLGRADDARLQIDQHMADCNHDPKLLLLRAGICTLANDLEQAAADYGDLITVLDGLPWAVEQYGLVLTRLDRYEEALSFLRPLLDTSNREDRGLRPMGSAGQANRPPSPAVLRAVATCHIRLDSPRRAQELLQEYLQDNPTDARAWWLLAEASLQRSDWSTVRRCLDRGGRLAPDRPHWEIARAYLAWQQGDAAQARAILKTLLADRPDDATVHSFLGAISDWKDD